MKNKAQRKILILTSFLYLALAFPLNILSYPGLGRKWSSCSDQQAVPRQKEMELRQRFREDLILLKLLRMTKALDLTEEQAARIFPIANKIEKEKMELNRQVNQQIRELRTLLSASSPDEARIKEKLAKIKELRESIRLKDAEFETFLEKNLTIVQKGKYILFNLEFAQFLSRNLERIRNMQGQPLKAPIKKTPDK